MIGIIKGDLRYYYLYKLMDKAIISNKISDFYNLDVLFLPFGGIDNKYIIKNTNIDLRDLLKINSINTIFVGNANKELELLCKENNIRLYEFLKDDEFIRRNAKLTAKGLLYLIHEGDSEIYSKKILITGYGNIGFYLAKLLTFYKANFKIYSSNDMERKYSKLEGYDTIDNINENFDIIINTIPAWIKVNYDYLKKTKIYDLASMPYGFDSIKLNDNKIEYRIMSSIPLKYAAKDAANIIFIFFENVFNTWGSCINMIKYKKVFDIDSFGILRLEV